MSQDKPTQTSSVTTTHNTQPTGLRKNQTLSIGGGLHARLRNPQNVAGADPLTRPDRIALMVDVSGSMAGAKIQSLRDAVTGFVSACDAATTALALEPFGDDFPSAQRIPLTCVLPLILTSAQLLNADGSTPMARAMDYVLNTYSITRGVIVSDGQPDSEAACYTTAQLWKEASLPCDCVHIGASASGEACLQRIAEITGGQYIKFTDVTSFSKAFKYLTPAFYAQLTAGEFDDEVRRLK